VPDLLQRDHQLSVFALGNERRKVWRFFSHTKQNAKIHGKTLLKFSRIKKNGGDMKRTICRWLGIESKKESLEKLHLIGSEPKTIPFVVSGVLSHKGAL
jgi:hypothetical protein